MNKPSDVMDILLITGIPGTGKTTIGDYLHKNNGFEHFNIEKILNLPQVQKTIEIEKFVNKLELRTEEKIVITWGFRPGQDDKLINYIKSKGAKMVWLDGNRKAAREAFTRRGDIPEHLLDIQLKFIDAVSIDMVFQPIRYNTFKRDGSFKSIDTIVEDLIKTIS